MDTAFTIVQLFPYWGFAAALTFLEIALHFRRRGRTARMGISVLISLVFLALVGVWFAKRGDLNSHAWVRAWLGS